MDIDKLVEDGARALEPKLFSDDERTAHMAASPLKIECARKSVREKARAVGAVFLKAAAEEADDRAQTYADLANRHDGTQMGASYTYRCGACASVAGRLRTLAAQLGDKTDEAR